MSRAGWPWPNGNVHNQTDISLRVYADHGACAVPEGMDANRAGANRNTRDVDIQGDRPDVFFPFRVK